MKLNMIIIYCMLIGGILFKPAPVLFVILISSKINAFLAHLSYCDPFLSVVHKLFTFSTFSQRDMAGFLPNLVGIILRQERSKIVQKGT